MIKTFIKNKNLLFADYFFASKFYKKDDESILLALSYIFAAARHGHFCVKIKNSQLFPCPDFLFSENFELLPFFEEKVLEGLSKLPEELVEKADKGRDAVKPIIFFNNSYYLHRNYIVETCIANRFTTLNNELPSIRFSENEIETELAKVDSLLNEKQKEAIKNALRNSVSFIFGGPGTGKSYTAAILIGILTNLVKDRFKVILTAPTGKAVLNLESKVRIGKAQNSLISVTAQTLHAMLNVNSPKDKSRAVDGDFIIVDEVSMVDAKIFSLLLESIRPGVRVLFIGDPDQLPPIESGNLFSVFAKLNLNEADMKTKSLSQNVKCQGDGVSNFMKGTFLSRAHRNESLQMSKISEAIKLKDARRFLELLKEGQGDILYKEIGENINETVKEIIGKAEKYYLPLSVNEGSFDFLLKNFFRFKILTALKVGKHGVDYLNDLIFEYISSHVRQEGYMAYPIIITKNDYDLDLYNGTMGVVIRKKINGKKEETAYFYNNTEDSVREIPTYKLQSFDLSYVLSVHKSQGSEFEDVLIVFPESSAIFGKEMLYTAITRTKKHLSILSSDKTIRNLISSDRETQNNLYERLSSYLEGAAIFF